MATGSTKRIKTPAGLYLKIREIQSEAEKAEKDLDISIGGRRYNATSIEAVLDVYLPILKRHNMSLVPVSQVIVQTGAPTNPHDFIMDCKYALIDIETGDSHEFNVHTNCVDGSDKAAGKGMTYALKYAYLQLFSGRRGDDPDAQDATNGNKASSQPQQQKKQDAKPAKTEPAKAAGKDGDNTLSVACMTIKQHFDIKAIAESQDVPKWEAFQSFTKGITDAIKDVTIKANVNEFSKYWWLCCLVTGGKDISEVKQVYAKAKAKLTKAQKEFIDGILIKREDAFKSKGTYDNPERPKYGREPGEDG